MKKFVLLTLILFVTIIAESQTLQKNSKGEYRIVSKKEKWENTRIIYEKGTENYLSFFPEAIKKADTPILVEKKVKLLKKYLFRKVYEVKMKEIVYSSINNQISFIKLHKTKLEEKNNFLRTTFAISLVVIFLGLVGFVLINWNK